MDTIQTDRPKLSFDYVRSPDQDSMVTARHAVVVVGAGPVGLATAVDLAQSGVAVVVLDDDGALSTGSRAICFAKRTLEIFDRLGCGEAMARKGVSWRRGKVFYQDRLAYSFDLLPEAGHERPAFVNLQQYYVEAFLLDRARELPALDLRWRNRLTGIEQDGDGVTVTVDTPDGPYRLHADYLVAADGSRSPTRGLMGLESTGRVFQDRFLIADVRMQAAFPTERWFWFDPPFHPGQSVLLHKQPDDVWRIDFQLGWDADPVAERQPDRVIPRVQALLGADVAFELEWVSVYTFACLRMERFRHARVLFAGDAAHGVSPFGARGANGGVQDAENLAWKLRLVTQGQAPDALLDSYAAEREYAADENILASTRSTDFITPKTAISGLFRAAVLQLAQSHPFARRLVNSGRLSVPATLHVSPLSTPDAEAFSGPMMPGAPSTDAPVVADGKESWFLRHIGGEFAAVLFADHDGFGGFEAGGLALRRVLVVPPGAAPPASDGAVVLVDRGGLLTQRFDARPGTTYLLRPDQHVCARWRRFDLAALRSALARATGHAT